MSKSRLPGRAARGRSASGDDQFLDAKRGGVALVVDDLADERPAAAAGASSAAGACDLAARVRARAHDFAHGLIGNALALADEHSRVSSRSRECTLKELKFKIIFAWSFPAGNVTGFDSHPPHVPHRPPAH